MASITIAIGCPGTGKTAAAFYRRVGFAEDDVISFGKRLDVIPSSRSSMRARSGARRSPGARRLS